MATEQTFPDELRPVAIKFYQMGRQARANGQALEHNPCVSSDARRSWRLGWTAMDMKIATRDEGGEGPMAA